MLMISTDSASSTANATASSNYASPTLSASSLPQSQEAPTSQLPVPEGATSLHNTLSESQGKAGQGTKGPTVPVRSSSNAKLQALGATSMIEQTGASPVSISRKGSEGSIKPKSRSGSTASKQSKKLQEGQTVAIGQGKVEEPTAAPKKKRGGFLSLLNCCSAPENANTVEIGDQAVPAKKARVLQQKPGRQPTPQVKANASAAESSTGESKGAEESIGGPEYSELKPAAKPTMITRSSKDKVATEKTISQGATSQPATELKEKSVPLESRDTAIAATPIAAGVLALDMKNGQGMPSAQASGIEAPPQIIPPEESVAAQGTTINDRTPQQEQRDSDVAMADAPPVVPDVDEQPNAAREIPQMQAALPPPPPRNGGATTAVNNEPVKALLPPLQQRLEGRKCLVLDLDETLVHSSFKVSLHEFLIAIKLTAVDTTSSRFPDTGRDRGVYPHCLRHKETRCRPVHEASRRAIRGRGLHRLGLKSTTSPLASF